jgi:REP element-mobilizing transposase RayT
MPEPLASGLVYIVFSTEGSKPIQDLSILPPLHAYVTNFARDKDCECFRVGGVADDVHPAIRMSRTITIAKFVEDLKTNSSKCLKTQSQTLAHFARQNGYGTFSIGPSDLEALRTYIDSQEEHHRKHTFQEEYRALLKKYGVEFDER